MHHARIRDSRAEALTAGQVTGISVPEALWPRMSALVAAIRETWKRNPGATCRQYPHALVDHDRVVVGGRSLDCLVSMKTIALPCSVCACLHFQGAVMAMDLPALEGVGEP